jgi:hypothetical protein
LQKRSTVVSVSYTPAAMAFTCMFSGPSWRARYCQTWRKGFQQKTSTTSRIS